MARTTSVRSGRRGESATEASARSARSRNGYVRLSWKFGDAHSDAVEETVLTKPNEYVISLGPYGFRNAARRQPSETVSKRRAHA